VERATTLLNQSVALRSVMLLSGENGVGKSALVGRWLCSLEAKLYFPVRITQASLTGIGLLALFLQKLGKVPKHQRSQPQITRRSLWRIRSSHSGVVA
jgi:hypothetical protein